jgi:FkbM family methyltransferase
MLVGDLRRTAQTLGRLALPVALDQALEARRLLRDRTTARLSLRDYRNAWLSRVHLLPPSCPFDRQLVVDVGANEGNFSAAILSLVPWARVLAVEPAAEPRRRLEARLSGRSHVEIVGQAVADVAGTATFNITAHGHNSSLHKPRPVMQELYDDPGWAVVREEQVETTTLDRLVGDRDVAVLKLDVQGGELDVLRGGVETLQRTAAVLLEVTFVSHYEGDASFQRLNEEMVERGFDLVGLSQPATTREGVTTWADACYARSSPASGA